MAVVLGKDDIYTGISSTLFVCSHQTTHFLGTLYQFVATVLVAWSWIEESNPQPVVYKATTLPFELIQHIRAAVARRTLASKPLNRDGAGTIPWKANPLTPHLILTYLEDSIRFELMMLVKHTGFQDLRNKPNSANYPFLLVHEIGKLLCQFEIYVSFADIFHEFYILQTDTAYSI